MGGKAFQQASAPGEPSLLTPRMPTETYTRLRLQYLKLLQKHFGQHNVETTIPAPQKRDHGDIDFMVRHDHTTISSCSFVALANEIGAAAVITSPSTCNFAVHVDGTRSSRSAVIYHYRSNNAASLASSTGDGVKQYAQIDLDMVPDDLFNWVRFSKSYGDMLSILGHAAKPLGLSVRYHGVFLRLPELDVLRKMDKVNVSTEQGCVFLSKDPNQFMEFLHLSTSQYAEEFGTIHEFYTWLSGCRLLTRAAIESNYPTTRLRRRIETRTVFSEFYQEWLPTNRSELYPSSDGNDDDVDNDHGESSQIKEQLDIERNNILHDAISYFDKAEEVSTQRRKLQRIVDNAKAANLLMPIIIKYTRKQDKELNEIMRSFRRFVSAYDDGTPYITSTPCQEDDVNLFGLLTENRQSLKQLDHVDGWIHKNWERVRCQERQRLKAYGPMRQG